MGSNIKTETFVLDFSFVRQNAPLKKDLLFFFLGNIVRDKWIRINNQVVLFFFWVALVKGLYGIFCFYLELKMKDLLKNNTKSAQKSFSFT